MLFLTEFQKSIGNVNHVQIEVYDILLGDKCLETSVLCLFYIKNRLIFVPVIKWYKNDSIIHEGKYNRTKP
jgi:hypothetical protein